jgi:hypothetical protein
MYLGAGVVLLAVGAGLRLNQYLDQVLLDDEWHAVHQLLAGQSPLQLFLTFGHADYSIPLGLLYWLQARCFGLSEFAMRWPMLLAGLATLVLFPLYAWRRFSPRAALAAALLFALSPSLIIYAHQARPYALTLLLAYLGLYAFYRYQQGQARPEAWGGVYVVSAVLATWLHPLMGPFVVSPLLLEAGRALAAGRPHDLKPLLGPGLACAAGLALVLGPPLVSDLQGIALKSGQASVAGSTLAGAVFFWLGTPSAFCAVVLLALAGPGLRRLVGGDRVWQSALLGLLLTALAILVLRPASVNHAATFGRYLLPALPLLLLAAALGLDELLAWRGPWKWPALALVVAMVVVYTGQSPVWGLAARPNSNANHSRFISDYREAHNAVIRYQQRALGLSPFWAGLREAPARSLRVGVAPFYFESYHWDGPRWEALGGQLTVPAYLEGFCASRRRGESPKNSRFRFRNAVYLSELADGKLPGVDWLVFNKPIAGFEGTPEGRAMSAEAERCLGRLQALMGAPDYEDALLVAYRLKPAGAQALIQEQVFQQGRAGLHGVALEIPDALRAQYAFVDEKLAGAFAGIAQQDGVGGIGHDVFLATILRLDLPAQHVDRGSGDHGARPQGVDRNTLASELGGHAQHAHAHAVLG